MVAYTCPMDIVRIDLLNPMHRADLIGMLDHYAQSPEGGGEALPAERLQNLPVALGECPTWIGMLAYDDGQAVGLCNAFWSVSTFAARRLLNIHDIAVHVDHRRRGIARQLIGEMEGIARAMGCCKLTLEVLAGNRGAMTLYEKAGFAFYSLRPEMGQACFMQKWLED